MSFAYKYSQLLDFVVNGFQFYSSDYYNDIDVGSHTAVLLNTISDPCIYLSVTITYASIKFYRFIILITQIIKQLKQLKQRGFYELLLEQKSRIIILLLNYSYRGSVYVLVYILLKMFN